MHVSTHMIFVFMYYSIESSTGPVPENEVSREDSMETREGNGEAYSVLTHSSACTYIFVMLHMLTIDSGIESRTFSDVSRTSSTIGRETNGIVLLFNMPLTYTALYCADGDKQRKSHVSSKPHQV